MKQRTGRKISPDYENPIDNVLIQISDWVCPALYEAPFGVTPNMLTTMSNLFSILGLYFFYNEAGFKYFLCIWMGYFFDCLDGHFARKYDMCTVFGDYYDHISDLIIHAILFIVWGVKYSHLFLKCSRTTQIVLISIVLFVALMTAIHVACQEAHHFRKADKAHHSDSLVILK